MSAKSLMKRIVDVPLGWFNLELTRRDNERTSPGNYRLVMPTCLDRLAHARSLGFAPAVILDGGAFTGSFTSSVAELFPGSQVIAVEPNPFVQEALKGNTSHLKPQPIYCEVALSDRPGESIFNIWGDPGTATSASLHGNVRGGAEHPVVVELDTVDRLAERFELRPDLIKLDLQGSEANALRGSQNSLSHAEMVIVEFGCLEAYEGRTTPRQLMDLLYDFEFCLYDVVDCHYRPYDGALTGGDFFFVKQSSALKNYKAWS